MKICPTVVIPSLAATQLRSAIPHARRANRGMLYAAAIIAASAVIAACSIARADDGSSLPPPASPAHVVVTLTPPPARHVAPSRNVAANLPRVAVCDGQMRNCSPFVALQAAPSPAPRPYAH